MTTIREVDRDSIPRSPESRLFAEKAARSVAEIQGGLNDVSDVVSFLEILGYDEKVVKLNGFSDLTDLASYIFDFIESYEDKRAKVIPNSSPSEEIKVPISSVKSRFLEAIAAQAPWMGALLVLCVTGVSLWMANGLPSDVTTFFVAGVFTGLILSEGILQVFSRLLFMYYDQRNLGEAKRIVYRSFISAAAFCSLAAAIAIAFYLYNVPVTYCVLYLGAAGSVLFHRVSFNLLYVLKMAKSVMAAYTGGFAAMLVVFYLALPPTVTSMTERYFISLACAFVVLSLFSLRSHIIALRKISLPAKDPSAGSISFYKAQGTVKKTLESHFWVQAFEYLPNFIAGLFFFVMLFGDRVISWFDNPQKLVITNIQFPFAFNNQYHAGADLALLVLMPSALVQYILLSPLYARVQNKAVETPLRDMQRLSLLVHGEYRKAMVIVLAVAGLSVILLNGFGDSFMSVVRGTYLSLQVLRAASIGNLALAVFTTNLIFLSYVNRSRLASHFIILGAILVVALGSYCAQFGVANIAVGYMGAIVAVAASSTFYTLYSIGTETVRALTRLS